MSMEAEPLPVDTLDRHLVIDRPEWLDQGEGRVSPVTFEQVGEAFAVTTKAIKADAKRGNFPLMRFGPRTIRINPRSITTADVRRWKGEGLSKPPRKALPDGPLVYFVGAGDFVKIGHTVDVAKRIEGLQCGCPLPIELLAAVRGGLKLEQAYHEQFAAFRVRGEWFEKSDAVMAEVDRLKV